MASPPIPSSADFAEPACAQLRESRARADRACEVSRLLCERARIEVGCARALRTVSVDEARSWRAWRRLWRRLMSHARPLTHQSAARPLVRVCMYCARVYVALPLAGGIDEADRA